MMNYRVLNESSGEGESSIEAHVLARAYRAVWRCTYGTEPTGRHQIAGLQLIIDFGKGVDSGVGTPELHPADFARPIATNCASPDVTSSSRCNDSAAASADAMPENSTPTDLWARVRQFGKRMPSEELELLIAELREQDQLRCADSQHGASCRNRRRDD
jgi:hypothetical protein